MKHFIRKFKCKLGCHSWYYFHKIEASSFYGNRYYTLFPIIRVCKHCGKKEKILMSYPLWVYEPLTSAEEKLLQYKTIFRGFLITNPFGVLIGKHFYFSNKPSYILTNKDGFYSYLLCSDFPRMLQDFDVSEEDRLELVQKLGV